MLAGVNEGLLPFRRATAEDDRRRAAPRGRAPPDVRGHHARAHARWRSARCGGASAAARRWPAHAEPLHRRDEARRDRREGRPARASSRRCAPRRARRADAGASGRAGAVRADTRRGRHDAAACRCTLAHRAMRDCRLERRSDAEHTRAAVRLQAADDAADHRARVAARRRRAAPVRRFVRDRPRGSRCVGDVCHAAGRKQRLRARAGRVPASRTWLYIAAFCVRGIGSRRGRLALVGYGRSSPRTILAQLVGPTCRPACASPVRRLRRVPSPTMAAQTAAGGALQSRSDDERAPCTRPDAIGGALFMASDSRARRQSCSRCRCPAASVCGSSRRYWAAQWPSRRGSSACVRCRRRTYIPLNNPVKLRLTSSFSGWPFTRDQLAAAQVAAHAGDRACVLTSVERWICQNTFGSSSSTSSLIGLRISASSVRGLHARVLLVGDEEQHLLDRDHLDVLADGRLDPLQVPAPRPGPCCAASFCSSCCMSAALGRVARRRRAARAPRRFLHALDRHRQALALGGLEHVVDHALLEGLDRVLVVGGDEDDLAAEPASSVVVVGRQLRDLRAPPRRRSCRACGCRGTRGRAGAARPAAPPRRRSSPRPTISSSGQTSARRARSCSRIRRSSSAMHGAVGLAHAAIVVAARRRAGGAPEQPADQQERRQQQQQHQRRPTRRHARAANSHDRAPARPASAARHRDDDDQRHDQRDATPIASATCGESAWRRARGRDQRRRRRR